MKKEEKEVIYNLLKTADSYASGYVRKPFQNMPVFSDDEVEEVVVEPVSSQTTEPVSHGMSISELNAKILRCTRCQLARTRNNVVPGQGVENPLVLVVAFSGLFLI